jgi:putative transposase
LPTNGASCGRRRRYHRSIKNGLKLDVYDSPGELERAIAHFVESYNHRRLHESLQDVTPADTKRQAAILDRRARITRRTLARRKRETLSAA